MIQARGAQNSLRAARFIMPAKIKKADAEATTKVIFIKP